MDELVYENACCCNCSLQEALAWVSGVELVWAVTNLAMSIGFLVKAKTDKELNSYWARMNETSFIPLLAILIIHALEIAVALVLLSASCTRRRAAIFAWLAGVAVLSIATIGLIGIQYNDWAFPLIYIAMCIIPFRFYFIYLAWCFSKEVVLHPDASPYIRVVKQQAPSTVVTTGGSEYPVNTRRPAAYPTSGAPAYAYRGGGYGRGGYYGRGYNNDLETGIVLGALATHHHHPYYYDDYYYGPGIDVGIGVDYYDDYGYGGYDVYDDYGGGFDGGYYDSDY